MAQRAGGRQGGSINKGKGLSNGKKVVLGGKNGAAPASRSSGGITHRGGGPAGPTAKKRTTTPAKKTTATRTTTKTTTSTKRQAQPTAPAGQGQGVVANTRKAVERNQTSQPPGRGSSVAVAKKGDTIWGMASKATGAKTNAQKVQAMNTVIKKNPNIKDPNKIKPGDFVRVH